MLIYIDPSICDADFSKEYVCRALDDLFGTVYRGEHYVTSTREVLAFLLDKDELSVSTRGIIKGVAADFSQMGALRDMVGVRLTVVHNNVSSIRKISDGQWSITTYDVAVNGIRKAILLAENLNDARLFEHAAKQYCAFHRIGSSLNIELSGGGGSTTPNVYRNFVEAERRLVLCVTDSDRECPEDGMSLMARRCDEISRMNGVVTSHFDLESREIENIIPLTFLGSVVPVQKTIYWQDHISCVEIRRVHAHRFCDLKHGISFNRIFNIPEGSRKKVYWADLASRRARMHNANCIDREDCVATPCTCYVTNGFGEGLLEAVVDFLNKGSASYFEAMSRNDTNKDEWMRVGKMVFEWGCSPKRMRC